MTDDHHDHAADMPAESDAPVNDTAGADTGADGEPKKKKRRRRRRKPKGEGAEAASAETTTESTESSEDTSSDEGDRPKKSKKHDDDKPKKKRKRRRGRKEGAEREDDAPEPERTRTSKKFDPAAAASLESFDTEKTFADLGLTGDVLKGIEELGFVHPTKIQAALIPVALTGVDVIGLAKTGTGKTASFALPLLQMVEPGKGFQALILAPTRELALQIRQDIDDLGVHSPLKTIAVYGGQKIQTQADRLHDEPEIIVGTPGRVMDMNERGYLPFNKFRFAVLDEVDRMFDIGFREDIRRILKACPDKRQTIFVSATMTDDIERLARRYMHEPEKLNVSSGSLTVEMVKQHYLAVEPWDKHRLLAHVLTHEEPALTLVFCRMKRTVDKVVRKLSEKGIEAHAMHGDMSQSQRNQVMGRFRKGSLTVLVASDLASRGLDVDGITHVVNYDLPDDPDIYVHRIGRTARAGRDGVAWSFVTPAQGTLLTEIENLINAEVPKLDYDDFEARPRPDDWKDEPTGGRPPAKLDFDPVEPENRMKVDAPDATEMSDEEKARKFPGGVVPTKLPPKLMRGKVRTRGR